MHYTKNAGKAYKQNPENPNNLCISVREYYFSLVMTSWLCHEYGNFHEHQYFKVTKRAWNYHENSEIDRSVEN